jgi:glycosyltransferase involved in cell wall biosynthesis
MKVLMISSDRNILAKGSAVALRMKEYGRLVEELHIILMSDKSHGLIAGKLADNVWVYPTNSLNKFLRPLDAVKIGKRLGCDIITAQDPFECGWAGMKLKSVKGVPLEVQLHTDPSSPNFGGLLNVVRKHIMKRVMKKANSVRSVADLPIYVDRSRIEGRPSFDLHERYGFKTVLLMVSRLSEEKRIGLALEALRGLSEAGLVIVGSGPEEGGLRALASELGVESRVRFEGWQEELSSYYQTADIFLQTSMFEGYGLSLVEAGLSGLPVVTTRVGIAKALKNVMFAESASDIAEAVIVLCQEPGHGTLLKQELESIVLAKEAYLDKIASNWRNLVQK